MYPDLSYLLADIFGTRVDNFMSIFKTFGVLLAMAFLASALVLRKGLKEREAKGELKSTTIEVKPTTLMKYPNLIINALIAAFFVFKIPYIAANYKMFKEDPASILFSLDGNLIYGFIAFLIFMGYAVWSQGRAMEEDNTPSILTIWPSDRVMDITLISAVSGILGAKLFVIFESAETFRAFLSDPAGMLLSGSGLAIYGGLITGIVVGIWYVRRLKIPVLNMLDAVAPALIIGYAVGRMGCHFAGDGDWGIINTALPPTWWFLPDWVWSYDYPNTVLRHYNQFGNSLSPIADCSGYISIYEHPIYCNKLTFPVFPTPIYETLAGLVIFAILWAYRNRVQFAGQLFCLYLILNGIERYFIEKIRVNDKIEILGQLWTQAEFIAVLFMLSGIIGWFLLARYNKK